MKKILPLILMMSCASMIWSQHSGVIKYKETMKLNIQLDDIPGVDLSDQLPESTSFMRELHFANHTSLYKPGKGGESAEAEFESDDGSFKMVMKFDDDVEEVLYTNFKEKKTINQKGFMGKAFVVEEPLAKSKWKITNEKIKFLDYECIKAEAEIDSQMVVAWFAPQLPPQIGPHAYNQLPGTVLMVSVDDGELEIMATEVSLKELESEIKPPKGGKRVSQEEYERIVEEKTKEMEEMGGGTRIIINH